MYISTHIHAHTAKHSSKINDSYIGLENREEKIVHYLFWEYWLKLVYSKQTFDVQDGKSMNISKYQLFNPFFTIYQ